MQRKFIKDMKSWECFFLTMFRRLQGSNNKFRCIQHCDTLNLQNNACLCNHFRLTVNIPNKRFLILILILIGGGGQEDDKHLHFDVIKWKHIPRYWPFVRGIHRSPATVMLVSNQWMTYWSHTRSKLQSISMYEQYLWLGKAWSVGQKWSVLVA